ncbi:HIT-like domain-containing protein [Limtongia smithiae]|uniref:HIT-like domain-containing protein n=1 Tax=Limtongia smithiae TaxID=1125753 RepID=UPI0034CF5A91
MSIHFGPFVVTKQVFYKSTHSFALVNLKPLLPGHVMVCPFRVVPRIADLTVEEVADLFVTVQRVSSVIADVYKGQSLNIAVQDGPLAGQSVPHVHCHVIPRKLNDLPNVDDVYTLMNSREADIELSFQQLKAAHQAGGGALAGPDLKDTDRLPRTEREMWDEADMLRSKMATAGPVKAVL